MKFSPANVRAELARRHMTQQQLAALVGLSESAIVKMLRPDGNPQANNLAKIASALGVNPGLFFETDQHNSVETSAIA